MKFCRFCGKQLGDDEVCDCEESKKAAENAEGSAEATSVIDSDKDSVTINTADIKENIKKNKNALYMIGAAIAVCLFFVLCVNLFSSSYKTPIKAVVKAINKGEKADYLTLYNASLPKNLKKLNTEYYTVLRSDKLDDLNDDLKDSFEELTDKYPKFKIKFDFDSAEKLSKTELKEYKDELSDGDFDDIEDIVEKIEDQMEDNLDTIAESLDVEERDVEKYFKDLIKYFKSFKKIKVTKGYKVRGRFIVKNGGDEINKTGNVTMYVLKINGNWVIYEAKNNDSFSFDSDKKSYDKISFLRKYINIFYKKAVIPDMM